MAAAAAVALLLVSARGSGVAAGSSPRSSAPPFSAAHVACVHRAPVRECLAHALCLHELHGFDEAAYLHARQLGRQPLADEPRGPACTPATCLNRTRCRPPFRVFAYSSQSVPASLARCVQLPHTQLWDADARELLTDDPGRACVFWIAIGGSHLDRCLRAISDLPSWRPDGLNHLVQPSGRLGDKGIPARARARYLGRAAIAQGHSTAERFVRGLDIALSLDGKARLPPALVARARAAADGGRRRWLLTFKGTVTHLTRALASLLHDERRRVVVVANPDGHACDNSTSELHPVVHAKPVPMPRARCCGAMRAAYDSYAFDELLDTTFALVLQGRQPASYRLAEVLAVGAIPVFYGFDDAHRPYADVIDWRTCALTVPAGADGANALLPALERLEADGARLRAMRAAGRAAYEAYIAPGRGHAAVLETLRRRFEFEDG